MLGMGDLIIIGFLVAACCLFIIVIIIARRILLGRFSCKQWKRNSALLVQKQPVHHHSPTHPPTQLTTVLQQQPQKFNTSYVHDPSQNDDNTKELPEIEFSNPPSKEDKEEMKQIKYKDEKRSEKRGELKREESQEGVDVGEEGKTKSLVTKAISCDSILSDLEVSSGDIMRLGQLEASLLYSRQTSELTVSIIQARDLEKDDVTGVVDSFVQVWLTPRNQGKFQTNIQKDNDCPRYAENIIFNVPGCEFELQILKFQVLSPPSKEGQENKILGKAELRLGDILGLTHPFKVWLNLLESNYEPPDCGDVLFSMSYLPTAERLTVIIIKARDLKLPPEIQIAECFVKVHLLQNNRRVQKKKTSTKKDERNPIYNESMTFMVPATSLQSLQLRVSVIGNLVHGGTYQIGHVTVGSKVAGTELVHWNQTLNCLRKQTSMWHRLKK